MKISIIGDGGWGTTLAILLNNKGYNITLWGAFEDYAKHLYKTRVNSKFLPGVKIPKSVHITHDIRAAVLGPDLMVLAVPSQYLRAVLKKMQRAKPRPAAPFLSVTKGIENKSLMRMSGVVSDIFKDADIAVLSGPTISHEVSRGMPATVVAASENQALARHIQRVFAGSALRVYTSLDVLGVELGGALKNVIAIAAGTLDGLGLGANTKAALLTRGLVEISRLGMAMGAARETFYGISGLGDLVTTCISEYGRNRWFGEQVGKGKRPGDILKKTDMVIEGVATTKAAYDLATRYRVDMPITQQVYEVLYKGKAPKRAIQELMSRPLKAEEIWFGAWRSLV